MPGACEPSGDTTMTIRPDHNHRLDTRAREIVKALGGHCGRVAKACVAARPMTTGPRRWYSGSAHPQSCCTALQVAQRRPCLPRSRGSAFSHVIFSARGPKKSPWRIYAPDPMPMPCTIFAGYFYGSKSAYEDLTAQECNIKMPGASKYLPILDGDHRTE